MTGSPATQHGRMRRRTIGDGRLRLDVSCMCLGTMYFGTRTDEATSFAILDRFREAGGTSSTPRTTTTSGSEVGMAAKARR